MARAATGAAYRSRLGLRGIAVINIGGIGHALLFLLMGAGLLCPWTSEAAGDLDFLGYAQLTAEHTDLDDGIGFGADRVRLKGSYALDRFFGGLMIDLNAGDLSARAPGTLPNVVKDIYVGYEFYPKHQVRLGQFKTPVGMDFNSAGQGLAITKRGMETGLVLERAIGVMVGGRKLGKGFGYDVGLFNVAGRSSATQHTQAQVGDANAWALRLLYEAKAWQVQAAFASSQEAGGANTRDYDVVDLGASYTAGPWNFRAEWIDGSNVRGVAGRDESVGYFHVGYRLTPRWELVGRHYDGESKIGAQRTSLTNTFVGANYAVFDNESSSVRLQINYLKVGGSEATYTGVRGFRADAVLAQLQWLLRH